MKTKTLLMGIAAGAVMAGALPGTLSPAQAQEATTRVRVGPITDEGGLMPVGGSNEKLTARLQQSLITYLKETGKGITVESAPASLTMNLGMGAPDARGARKPTSRQSAPVAPRGPFTVSGHLTRVDDDPFTGGSYLWTVRLWGESADGPRMVGAWSALSESLRYLTANVRRDRRVHLQGAVGELGDRILMAVQTPSTTSAASLKKFNSWVDGLSKQSALSLTAVAEKREREEAPLGLAPGNAGVTAEEAEFNGQMLIGDAYRLRATPREAGEVFVLSLDKSGRPEVWDAQRDLLSATVAPGRDFLLPGAPFKAPRDNAKNAQLVDQREWVVIFHRTPSADTGMNAGLSEGEGVKWNKTLAGDEPPVRLVGASLSPDSLSAEIARLMAQSQVDPANWSAQRHSVRLLPARN